MKSLIFTAAKIWTTAICISAGTVSLLLIAGFGPEFRLLVKYSCGAGAIVCGIAIMRAILISNRCGHK